MTIEEERVREGYCSERGQLRDAYKQESISSNKILKVILPQIFTRKPPNFSNTSKCTLFQVSSKHLHRGVPCTIPIIAVMLS